MSLTPRIAEKCVEPVLFLLRIGPGPRACRSLPPSRATAAIFSFKNLFRGRETRAGLVQPVPHGMLRILRAFQFVRKRALHKRDVRRLAARPRATLRREEAAGVQRTVFDLAIIPRPTTNFCVS